MEQPFEMTEKILRPFRPLIGQDYRRYKNHVDRVLSFCLLLDDERGNLEKYAIAAAFHDIGIWTDRTLDYLPPSIWQAENYLAAIGKSQWTEEISLMIYWHHKTGRYQGRFAKTVETFRRADWVDVSLGWRNFGVKSKQVRSVKRRFPNLGFHWFLAKKIAANLLRHPSNPLPMFKK